MIVACIFLLGQEAPAKSQNAKAHLGKGAELMRAERYQDAAKEFQNALNENAKLAQARLDLAICDFELRDYTAARELFSALSGLNPEARTATYYLGRIDLLNDDVDRAITRCRYLERGSEVRDEK